MDAQQANGRFSAAQPAADRTTQVPQLAPAKPVLPATQPQALVHARREPRAVTPQRSESVAVDEVPPTGATARGTALTAPTLEDLEMSMDAVGRSNQTLRKLQQAAKGLHESKLSHEKRIAQWLESNQERRVKFHGKSYSLPQTARVKKPRILVSDVLDAVEALHGAAVRGAVHAQARAYHVSENAELTAVTFRKTYDIKRRARLERSRRLNAEDELEFDGERANATSA